MAEAHATAPRYRLGVDIGGTFTDLTLHDARSGRLVVAKTLSTPSDPSRGALRGIELILERAGVGIEDVDQLVHATTHGANIVIEGAGARTALLVTEGFGDLLVIQRQLRHSPYDLMLERHPALVAREHVWELPERVRFDGSVHRELDEDAVREAIAKIRAAGIESIAVCLLHSYANDAHEQRVRALLAEELDGVTVSLSSEIAPVMREYERASTTVVNAFIHPAFERYLGNLEEQLAERGFRGSLFMMQANGGVAGIELTKEAPVRALESGPAGAVTMAAALARDHDLHDVLAFDMGGTTAKAGLVLDGRPPTVDVFEVDKSLLRPGTGLPVLVPSVDIIEIGAGGGSLARAQLGIIAVGPRSAGAEPGPACYGRGGSLPTVTDANLLLGYLDPAYFNGGDFELDVDAARQAVRDHVATPLGLGEAQAAWGIHEAVTQNMEHAIRAVSIDRGSDPRTMTLVASGGAAPLHALRLAHDLGMPRVLVPAHAGVLSSLGLLAADPQFDLATSVVADLDEEIAAVIDQRLAQIAVEADERLESTGLDGERTIERRLDLRYRGQGHTVDVLLPDRPVDAAGIAAARDAFAARYEGLFGAVDQPGAIELTAVRLTARVSAPSVAFATIAEASRAPATGSRAAYFPELGGYADVKTVRRERLGAGDELVGPAIVEDVESTVVVPPGDRVTVDSHSHLHVEIAPRSQERG